MTDTVVPWDPADGPDPNGPLDDDVPWYVGLDFDEGPEMYCRPIESIPPNPYV